MIFLSLMLGNFPHALADFGENVSGISTPSDSLRPDHPSNLTFLKLMEECSSRSRNFSGCQPDEIKNHKVSKKTHKLNNYWVTKFTDIKDIY